MNGGRVNACHTGTAIADLFGDHGESHVIDFTSAKFHGNDEGVEVFFRNDSPVLVVEGSRSGGIHAKRGGPQSFFRETPYLLLETFLFLGQIEGDHFT